MQCPFLLEIVCLMEDRLRFLVVVKGFVIVVKTYSFFSRTASTAVSDIVMSSSFFTAQLVNAHKKNLSNIAEILRQKSQHLRAGHS